MGYYYWDPTYILVVIGAVICMIASARVKGTFNKYSQRCEYLLNVPLTLADAIIHITAPITTSIYVGSQ